MPRPRFLLHAEAQMWRSLMSVGMTLHRINSPPPFPFTTSNLSIPTTLSTPPSTIPLTIITPTTPPPHACIINFHGGGFTLGTPRDDLYFLSLAAHKLNATIISPSYRLAPEHPFPTAILDGSDTLLWVYANTHGLKVDPRKIALLGWSAGGNMVFSVALRTHYEVILRGGTQYTPGHLAACIAFYPSTDFTQPRHIRRKTNKRADMELPELFTRLFDASYLWPPEGVDLSSPYLSPGVADEAVLMEGLPNEVLVVWCEWDELREEAERFVERLQRLGKRVWGREVGGRWHGWDKSPWGVDEVAKGVYNEVVEEVGRAFKRVDEGTKVGGEGKEGEEHPIPSMPLD